MALTVAAGVCGRGVKPGDSVAVNGCCLTVVNISPAGKFRRLRFDLLQESWKLTNLQFARPGSLMNLERSLRANGSLGGHFVTGHVDGLGKILRREKSGVDFHLFFFSTAMAGWHRAGACMGNPRNGAIHARSFAVI